MKKKIVFGIAGLFLALVVITATDNIQAKQQAKTRFDYVQMDCVGSSTACADETIVWG